MNTEISEADLKAALVDLARTELGRDDPVAADADLSAQLDSLQRLRLVVAIEDRFGVSFEPEDEAGVRTLDEAARVVRHKLGGRS